MKYCAARVEASNQRLRPRRVDLGEIGFVDQFGDEHDEKLASRNDAA
jgi:hypothetical protein